MEEKHKKPIDANSSVNSVSSSVDSLEPNHRLETIKVSNKKVKPVKIEVSDRPVKGADWFPVAYSNMYLLAKKNSGKTTTIYNILKHCCGKHTKFMFFSSTINKDPTWKKIIEYWEDKGNDVLSETSFLVDEEEDEETGRKGKPHNLLSQYLKDNARDNENSDDDEEHNTKSHISVRQSVLPTTTMTTAMPVVANNKLQYQPESSSINQQVMSKMFGRTQPVAAPIQQQAQLINTHNNIIANTRNITSVPNAVVVSGNRVIEHKDNIESKKKKYKAKYDYPKWVIILDDLAGEMATQKALNRLLKTNRHYKAMIIISSQSLNDLNPQQINQLDYTILFAGIPEDKLEELREKLVLNIPLDQFVELYKDATSKKYSFLYISRSGEFRKNFNDLYVL